MRESGHNERNDDDCRDGGLKKERKKGKKRKRISPIDGGGRTDGRTA